MTTCNCEPKLKLRCENVSKTFIQKGNQEVPVIRDATLDVYEHEVPGLHALCMEERS